MTVLRELMKKPAVDIPVQCSYSKKHRALKLGV